MRSSVYDDSGSITGDMTVGGDATISGDVVIDDGGSLKEAGGTAAFTFDGDGHVTKLGQDTPSTDDVATWDGGKVVWSPAAGGGVAADDANLVYHMMLLG